MVNRSLIAIFYNFRLLMSLGAGASYEALCNYGRGLQCMHCEELPSIASHG